MPTINPEFDTSVANVPRIIWETLATGDTVVAQAVPARSGLAGSVQISGTFGGATVVLQCSNDGTTYFTLTDTQGTDISATANSYFEFTTAAVYLRPSISGGTGDDVDVVVALRG